MRPDLLILDASEAVVAAQAMTSHHFDRYGQGDRLKAAGLLRLAENRLRQTRRRLEAGSDIPPTSVEIVALLMHDGWIPAENEPFAETIADSVADLLR
jgi:hypothetical protein